MLAEKYKTFVSKHSESSFNIINYLIHTLLVLETHKTSETNEIAIGEISILDTGNRCNPGRADAG